MVKAATAKRNIDSMTLRAKSAGYVSVQRNQNTGGMVMWGMELPVLQVGDTVRAGMAVAQIPDLHTWELSARIGELDRGHLAEGQPARIAVIALPGRKFKGKVKNIGGTAGPPWDRHFICKLTLEDPSLELRPGMTAVIQITTEMLSNVLWVPSQALFDSDGRSFVYLQTSSGFTPRDVTLVRRSESQAVITGVAEGHSVALANPDQSSKKKGEAGAMSALKKT
jgi:hypothetical protein